MFDKSERKIFSKIKTFFPPSGRICHAFIEYIKKQKRGDAVNNRYLKIDEIMSFDTGQPVLALFGTAKKRDVMPDLIVNCGQRRRVV